MTSPTWRVELARDEDLAEVAGVIHAAFGPHNPKSDFEVARWQYRNPFGPMMVPVARVGDTIVASCAAIPYRGVIDGRPVRIAITGDAAVHPDHRGQGIYAALHRARLDAMAEAGVAAAIMAPNSNSRRATEGVGWMPLGTMDVLAMPVLGFRSADQAATATLPEVCEAADRLWERLGHLVQNGVTRDSAWFRWRYSRPGADYRAWLVHDDEGPAGIAVAAIRKAPGRSFAIADVLELTAARPALARSLAIAMRRELRGSAVALTLGALRDSDLGRTASAAGFRRLPARLHAPLAVGVVDPTGENPLLHQAPWSLQWGDLDHL